jgi:hypothetical protein
VFSDASTFLMSIFLRCMIRAKYHSFVANTRRKLLLIRWGEEML